MDKLKAFTFNHPVSSYFIAAFIISWGGVLAIVGSEIPGTHETTARLFLAVYLVTIAGPSLASALLTGIVSGKAGFRELRGRLLKWRVGAWWYMIAVLTTPVTVMAALLVLSLTSPDFMPGLFVMSAGDALKQFAFVTGIGLLTGFTEELGWTGFAVPRLLSRHGVFATGVLTGIIWGAWHFVSNVWAGESAGGVSLYLFMPAILFSFLPPYRILMVWVYDRTRSLLVAMLMHASLVAFWLISMPRGILGVAMVKWYLVWAAILWGVVAVAAVSGQLSSPLRSSPERNEISG